MKKNNARLRIGWVMLCLVAVGVVVATVLAWYAVGVKRAAVLVLEEELVRLPAVTVREGALKAEIEKRALDVQRIRAFIVGKEQLAQVVSEIENIGRDVGITVSIPTVEEKEVLDENGNVVPPSGPLLDVRLKIVAIGNPKRLLSFLHTIEHMQRLTYFESWRLDASEATARNQATALQRGGEDIPLSERALLTADMIVAVSREEEGRQTP